MRENLKKLNFTRWPITYWRTLSVILSGVTAALVVFVVTTNIASNREAIEKGCIVLNNTIIKSQQQAQIPGTPTYELVQIILSQASPSQLRKLDTAVIEEERKGSPLAINCVRIAHHPEEVKAEQRRTSRFTVKRGNP